jgi:hypothetical protein
MGANPSEGSLISTIKKLTPLAVKKGARRLEARVRILGARYRCPVCDSRVKAFEPLPEFYAENAKKYAWPFAVEEAETCNDRAYQCPHCSASDRDRLYALYLRDYLAALESNAGANIVDFAPAPSLSIFIRRQIARSGKNVSYRTADAFAEGVDDKVDITDLTVYRDGQFDFFICSHVLEHVADDRKALRELYRILRQGGSGILMVPIILSIDEIDEDPTVTDEGERWRRFGQYDHVRLYSKNGFIERVKEAGFIVNQHDINSFGKDRFERNGIGNQSVLYVVQK